MTLWLGWLAALGIVIATTALVSLSATAAKTRIYLLLAASLLSIFAIGVRIEILDQKIPQGVVSFEYSVRSDAKPLPKRVFGSRFVQGDCSFRAESREINGVSLRLPMRVIAPECDASYGLVEIGSGRIIKSKEQRVAFTLIVNQVTSRNQSWLWKRLSQLRAEFRSLFEKKGRSGSLVPGMVIGDTALQESEFTSRMRLAGLSHLTAVSGTNFSIITTFVLALTARLTRRRGIRLACTLLTLSLFVLLVRPSPSVLRAGVMALIVLLAQLKGERRVGIAALGAAAVALLLIDPFLAQDLAFLLSILATAGIIVYSPIVSSWLKSKLGAPKTLSDLIAIPFSATLFTLPIVVAISEQFSLAQIPLNILASPIVPWVTITGFLAVPTLLFSEVLARFFSGLAEFGARFITRLADAAIYFPAVDLPGGFPGGLLVLVLIGIGVILYRYLSLRSLAIVIACSALVLPISWLGSNDWKLFQCDVGQGDGLLIRTGARSAIVIDVGPDAKLIDRCLRKAGIRQIPLLVITHAHADHYGGIEGAVRGRRVGEWWIASDPDGLSSEAMKEVEGVIGHQARVVAKGDSFRIADVKIDVIWPRINGSLVFASNPGDGSTLNNRSVVLMLEKAGAFVFLGGDIEPPVQEIIARDEDLSRVTIYKVSHHGSRFQSEFFDSQMNPSLALISVGLGNNFGHPARETLETLAPAYIHRTDLDGPARVSWWPLVVE